MDKKEFFLEMKKFQDEVFVSFTEEQLNKYYEYMRLLLEWNEKINLTSIVDEKEIIKKHFIDSLTINKYVKDNSRVIDVGTGAGFPGIPLKIYREDISLSLLDSLNKRINFLDEVINKIELKKCETVHSRAEDFGIKNRKQYDVVTSRAVAKLNVLLEYMMPITKIGGVCICMKGNNIEEEIRESKKAIEVLGGEKEKIDNFMFSNGEYERNIIVIKKIKETPKQYPRKAGTPAKSPIA